MAVKETEAAIALTTRLPCRYLVVHLGTPTTERVAPQDNQSDVARRSVEEIAEMADRANVRVALEVIPNALSSANALASLIEEELDGLDVGVCLDYGHAHLMGDLGDAIETLSGHLWTTHVHDNGGTRDDHLVPYAGSIDWDAAMMETQKIGYDGPLMFEVADTGDPVQVLERCVKARERLEKMFVTFEQP
jgi:sugar phosphate isomerase/epimerase